MTWTLQSHTKAGVFGNSTSPGIDTTGAALIIIAVGWDSSGNQQVPTDSKGNTWTELYVGGKQDGWTKFMSLWYAINPTVDTGHTFSHSAVFPGANWAMCVQAWSLSSGTPTLDQKSFNAPGLVSSVQPGSITPSASGALLATMVVSDDVSTVSINSGFTRSDDDQEGSAVGISMAYLVQSPAAAINPTWSVSGGQCGAMIASFTDGGGGGGGIVAQPYYALLLGGLGGPF